MAPQVLLAASFGIAVQALAFDGRQLEPIDSPVPNPTDPFPGRITTPPSALELAKRQEALTVLMAPDNTCGYLDGRAGAPLSCPGTTATCAFYPFSGSGPVGCCIDDVCNWSLTCLDYVQVYSSSLCDNGCMYDTFTLKCTSASFPYCGTASFFDGVMGYFCDSFSSSMIQTAETTYIGQTNRGRLITVTVESTSSSTSPPTSPPTGPPTGPPTSPPTSTSTSSPTSTPTAPPPSSGGDTGAIVGGVVGGVGGIALISLLTFFLIRSHNNSRTPPQQPPQMIQQFGPQGPPPGHESTYNPVHPSQQNPPRNPPQGAYPSGDYYHDSNKPGGFVNMAPAGDPDRQSSTSPTLHGSQLGADNRASMQQQPTSPTSTVYSNRPPSQHGPPQQQGGYPSGVPPTVHEAGSNVIGQPGYNDNHHGQLHEMHS